MDFHRKLALDVQKRRKEAGLSQAELALHAGVGRRFISELEAGKQALQLDKVLAVLAVFGRSLNTTAWDLE